MIETHRHPDRSRSQQKREQRVVDINATPPTPPVGTTDAHNVVATLGAEGVINAIGASTVDSIVVKDMGGRVLYGNEAFFDHIGRRDRVLGTTADTYLPEHLHKAALETDRIVLTEGRTIRVEYSYDIDGRGMRWYEDIKAPVKKDGRIVGLIGISKDVTQDVHDRQRQAMQVDDVNHRVRNILTTIRSLVRLSSDASQDPKQFYELVEQRIGAVGAALGLTHPHDPGSVSLVALINAVAATVIEPSDNRLLVFGNDVRVRQDHCSAIALVINELATNALRHGAWSTPEGQVEVAWTFNHERGMLNWHWRERNGRTQESPRNERGGGLDLLERLVRSQLRGSCAFDWFADGFQAHCAMHVR